MSNEERLFRLLLRIVGSAALLAIPFVFVPYAWMNAIHDGLGMGQLPDAPVVGYLARSASAFYAILGGLLWVLSFDLRRHRPVLVYLGAAILLFGLLFFAVDFLEGMPRWWALGEGPFNTLFGIVILVFSCRLGRDSG
jgi:hypothetical protein